MILHCRTIFPVLLFYTVWTAFSTDIATLNKQGVEALNAGDYRKAVACFIDVVKHTPADQTVVNTLTAACRSLAAEYTKQGDYENSVQTLRHGLALMPQSSVVRDDLISIGVKRGAAYLKTVSMPGPGRPLSEPAVILSRSKSGSPVISP